MGHPVQLAACKWLVANVDANRYIPKIHYRYLGTLHCGQAPNGGLGPTTSVSHRL